MVGYSDITFGGVSLNITQIRPVHVQKRKKNVIGKSLVQSQIIGLSDKQWEISLTGYIVGENKTDLYNKRSAIEILDDTSTHSYVDGIHDGTYYIVPGSLIFNDTEETAGTNMYLTYTMKLVEE